MSMAFLISLEHTWFVVATCYALMFVVSLVQLVRNCVRYSMWTMQKIIHLCMMLITAARTVFLFLVSFHWCDASSGTLDGNCNMYDREAFYILDEFPGLILLTIYTLLVLFWSEIYYNAIDNVQMQNNRVRPFAKLFNLFAYVVQFGIWVSYATIRTTERHYVDKEYAIFTSIAFFFVTIGFIWFGRLAYNELRSIPVELQIRKKKLKEVAFLTIICSTCFTLRTMVLLWISHQKTQLHDPKTSTLLLVYFIALEIMPSSLILYYYRRLPSDISSRERTPTGYRSLGKKETRRAETPDHLSKSLLGTEQS